jgi:hypothetical protein
MLVQNKNAVIYGRGRTVGGAVARACRPEPRPVLTSPWGGLAPSLPESRCLYKRGLELSPIYQEVSMTADRGVPNDSTIVAPEVHQVVFENEHVRVIDARAANGAKLRCTHTRPCSSSALVPAGRR